ncbi:S41 family peptidase [Streptomyces sp. TS71-3]|uniref:S41 family peptidase n=1 Tax=Streptomyces sp. TS71-3 TaxID=2733862 RepID=UPI002016E515|nr:S41 family peptidase [Streptomyces sp. TS71-3]
MHGDRLCFSTEDDLWLADLTADGTATGRAWRLTADRTKVADPRFSPDGRHIAFTSWRSIDPEIHLVPVEGGPARRLTYWGTTDTRICGWTPPQPDEPPCILAVGSHGQPFSHFSWAYKVPTDGSPGGRLPWGPVNAIDVADIGGEHLTLLLTGSAPHEPASWKRYRGGGTGRLWMHGRRLLEDLEGHLESPMFVSGRIAFLSDHEGIGNLYSCRPDGSDLRRHTDHGGFYARHASSDGRRVVYECAGEIWMVDELTPDSVPHRLDVRLGSPRSGRRRYQIPPAQHLDALSVDARGRSSAVVVRGSLHWLTHRDGPARAIADTPGVRVRLPAMLGASGRIAYVTDAAGEDSVEIGYLPRAVGTPPPLRFATGRLGRVLEMVPDPEGRRLAMASHDGRLLIVDVPDDPEDAAAAALGTEQGPQAAQGGPDGAGATAGATAGAGAAGSGGGGSRAAGPRGATRATGPGDAGVRRSARPGDTGVREPTGQVDVGVREPAGGTGQPDGDGQLGGGAGGERGAPPAAVDDATVVSELVRSSNGPVRDLAFSPDGGWLTWSHPGIGRSLRQIKLARIEDATAGDPGTGLVARTVVDVTDGRFEDESPVFTRDGRYLAFLSWRGFDPVYDVHTGDLSFPLGCRPYLVPLSSAIPSPFALLPDGRPAAGSHDPLGIDPADARAAAMSAGPAAVEVEGLASRVTPFPVTASKYSALKAVAGGGLVWLRWPISGALGETFANPADLSGRPTLEYFDISRCRKSELVFHLDSFGVSGDGSRLVVADQGELRAMPATGPGDLDTTVWIDLRRILQEVDPAAEWRGAFEEAGRLIRDYFWEPHMAGIDWPGRLAQYRPLVDRVATPDEFSDLLRELLGELGTSHAYVIPARRNEGPPHYQRLIGVLGADLVPREGGWTVRRILPGDSSDSKARSPLAGTGVREGAVLTHVDGRPVDPVTGPFPLLAGAGGTTVELTFTPAEGSAGGRGPRRVAVVPLIDERPLRYQDWVAGRRRVVRELSGGKCGYLHIPDMGGSGWAQFNRDLRREVALPALIVDVRGNAGGNISELVVEKLTRSILGWDLTRGAQPVSYAKDAPRGPIVALADESTASDGDMIIAAIKLLDLGPVVGQRTWGGVVGITGRHRLGDGTVITVPMNAAWFDAYGWSVENRGVLPDIPALRTPLDWAEGRYAQLDDAVHVALELLAEHPPSAPPDHTHVPARIRPKLPPRQYPEAV